MRDIQLADKELFDSYLRRFQPRISELTFTNLFAWRNSKKHEFEERDGHLLISFKKEGQRIFYQPVGPDPAGLISRMQDPFERVDEMIASSLPAEMITETPDQHDYVYERSRLVSLEGQDLASKRNFIKRSRQYDPQVCVLSKSTVHGYKKLQEQWCDRRDCKNDPDLSAENEAVREALTHFDYLGLLGVCVLIDGTVGAFSIGEKLNDETYVEHFEKGNSDFVGMYQLVLHEFVKSIPGSIKYVNREQDLGLEGLRKAKQSYQPVFMVRKYKVR